MSVPRESAKEAKRRAWVERTEKFNDATEAFARDKAAASTKDEKQAISQTFAEYRSAHRLEDERQGRRGQGMIAMHQIMWARWIEVAAAHEIIARDAFAQMTSASPHPHLMRELHASLVAVSSAAHTIEALVGDIKYRIPPQPKKKGRERYVWNVLLAAFDFPSSDRQHLQDEIDWLYARREDAVHPYTESVPPARHPSGINTGVECSLFNAVTSERALDLVLTLLGHAASPTQPANHWVERWVKEREAYHETVVQPIRDKLAQLPAINVVP